MNMGQQFNQAQSQHHNQNHHSKQAAQNVTPRSFELKDQIDQPVARRAVTTLLDMEI
jgi:hypothetical protein